MIHIDIRQKSYGFKPILQNITLSLEEGKIYGLIGKNGSGKTTLFECISGINSFEGKIEYNQEELPKRLIGLLPTEPYYIPRITAEEYISFCLHARKIKKTNWQSQNIFNLPLKQYAHTFSTGMKKKLALWALLLQDNEFFILDEPFNGVDFETAFFMKHKLLELKKQQKTIILSSHILSSLTEIADEIFVLDNQHISQTYTPSQFSTLEQAMYDKIVGVKII